MIETARLILRPWRDSDLPLRTAWPLFVINCINWFTDEDSQYLSSFKTGDVWRIPVVTIATPDHWHAPAAILGAAHGKHVYVEKPCGQNPYEGELLTAALRNDVDVIVQSYGALRPAIEDRELRLAERDGRR